MSRDLLDRITSASGVACAVLSLGALVGFVTSVGNGKIADSAGSVGFYASAAAALLAMLALALAAVGLYLAQRSQAGSFGAVAFTVALAGTMLGAGAQWTYVFVVPHFAGVAPALINEGSGPVLVGFVTSYAVLAIGWVLLGIATLRARLVPRPAAIAVIVGAAIAFLPMPSRTLVLAIAVAYVTRRLSRAAGGSAS